MFDSLLDHYQVKEIQADHNVHRFLSSMDINLTYIQDESPNPLSVYHDYCFPGHNPPAIVMLAWCLLSICANSASCKRLFSIFGNTLTKLRNHLGTETVTMIGKLKMYIRDEEIQYGTKKQLKQQLAP